MIRLFLALIMGAMVFLGTSPALAAYWQCTGKVHAVKIGTAHKAGWSVSEKVDAPTLYVARAKAQIRFGQRPDVTKYTDIEVRNVECKPIPPKPRPIAPPPPPAPLTLALKPPGKREPREWICRVKLVWHADDRSGKQDVTIVIDDASGQTDAEGKAIYRIQQRTRALFGDSMSRRVTFSQTSVTCV